MRPTEPLVELARSATPIFADVGRVYDYVQAVADCRPVAGGAEFDVSTHEEERLIVSVTFMTPEIVRLRCWGETPPPEHTPMLVLERVPPSIRVDETPDEVILASRALTVRVRRRPWEVCIEERDGREVWRQRTDDYSSGGYVSFPLGYSKPAAGGEAWFHESVALRPDEPLYGLGERYGPLNKRGTRHVFWIRDTHLTNTNDMSYMVVPFFWSAAGYGVFVNHTSPIVFEMGAPSTLAASFRAEDPYLDEFIIHGPESRTILSRYWDLTGHAPLPPLWSFGAWFSRCMYRDAEQMKKVAERLRDLDIPADVLHCDPRWLKERKHHALDGCDFVWDDEAFGDPQEFVDWLADRGFRLSLWENPYVWIDTDMYKEGAKKGYFALGPDGKPARSQENPKEAVVTDFTSPEAARWWQDKHRKYLRMGVASFKSDYGEALPPDARTSDGKTGRQWHNALPLLYNRAVWEVIHEERGEAIVFGRSGYAGSQRYPINWVGDSQCTWDGMAGALRAGLSLSDSGIPFWSHDIGGFWRATAEGHALEQGPDPALYVRWAQFGLLSSHARFHGVRGREPWWFGDDAVAIVRKFAQLRYRLLPYLWTAAHEAVETAMPVVRPMHMQFPDDPGTPSLDRQYMLGPALLVAPVFNDEGRVNLYLPSTPGAWYDFWTNESAQGGRWLDLNVSLDSVPLFVRGDSIVPLAPVMTHTGKERWEPLELRVWAEREASVHVRGEGESVVATARRDGDDVRVDIEGHGRVVVDLRAPDVADLTVEGGSDVRVEAARAEFGLEGRASVCARAV